jgi:hypothetical protein
MSGFEFGRGGSGRVLRVLGTGLLFGFIVSLAQPATAGVAQFYGFPGEYAAHAPYSSSYRPAYGYSGVPPYSPSYSRPMVPATGWAPSYYGAAPGAGGFSSWRSGGGAYDAGVFSSRSRRVGGGAYDGGVFFWR